MIFQVLFQALPAEWLFSIAFYNPTKKTIVNWGSSRACGCNNTKSSIHAEVNAINYCNTKKNNKLNIYIWRYNIEGNIKPAYCCNSCTKVINKYNYNNRVFTFVNRKKVSALVENPQISLAWKIMHNL